MDRLAQHRGFSFNATDAPTSDSQPIDHRGVRIGADERVRVTDSLFFNYTLREVFKVDLMADAQTRRHDSKCVKCLPAPLQKLIARMVALEFHCHVAREGIARS